MYSLWCFKVKGRRDSPRCGHQNRHSPTHQCVQQVMEFFLEYSYCNTIWTTHQHITSNDIKMNKGWIIYCFTVEIIEFWQAAWEQWASCSLRESFTKHARSETAIKLTSSGVTLSVKTYSDRALCRLSTIYIY